MDGMGWDGMGIGEAGRASRIVAMNGWAGMGWGEWPGCVARLLLLGRVWRFKPRNMDYDIFVSSFKARCSLN